MVWTALLLVSILVCVLAALPIWVHAFGRSVGTGVMVLFVPVYIVIYGFTQFEHKRRHILVPMLLGALILAGVTGGVALRDAFAPPEPTGVEDIP